MAAMTIKKFRNLDEMEQHEAMWNHGVMVGDRLDGEYRIILYQIFDFYLELFYHVELNVLKKLVSFDNLDGLDIYLNRITITDRDLN